MEQSKTNHSKHHRSQQFSISDRHQIKLVEIPANYTRDVTKHSVSASTTQIYQFHNTTYESRGNQKIRLLSMFTTDNVIRYHKNALGQRQTGWALERVLKRMPGISILMRRKRDTCFLKIQGSYYSMIQISHIITTNQTTAEDLLPKNKTLL